MTTSRQRKEDNGLVILVDGDPRFAQDVKKLVEDFGSFGWVSDPHNAADVIWRTQPRWILLEGSIANRPVAGGDEILSRLTPDQLSRVIVVARSVSESMSQNIARLGVSRLYVKSEPLTSLLRLFGEYAPRGHGKFPAPRSGASMRLPRPL